MSAHEDPVLIVGAGVFGLSLAWELKTKRGYANITVLDRYLPPVIDGSSVDISRVIRSEYADPFYAELAREALDQWREPPYAPFYHENGFVLVTENSNNAYLESARKDVLRPGARVEIFGPQEATDSVRKRYPGAQAKLDGLYAAHNPLGGWANAEGSIRALAERCSHAGISFITGNHGIVTQLVRDETGDKTKITGVKTAAGQIISALRVVLATGAWTSGLVDDTEQAFSSSGQPVGFIQLTPEEAAKLTPSPVIIHMESGVFVFPPTPDTHILKVARHGFGYTTEIPATATAEGPGRTVSGPKTQSNNAETGFIPEDASESLRAGLRILVPEFADRPWLKARLCWYTDTPESDFIADDHPNIQGLFVATGGSGHAFKMLPALGRHLADCFENKASKELRHKWRLRPSTGQDGKTNMEGDGSRGGPPQRLLSPQEQAQL